MNYITLNKNGFAEIGGFIKCYCVDPNGEYIWPVDEYIPATAGLPAGAYIDEPPANNDEGKAIIRVVSGWQLVEDHRGSIAYSTDSGAKSTIDYLGSMRDEFTLLKPTTPYDKWDGKKWVTDDSAEKEGHVSEAEKQRQILITQACMITADWRTELSLGIIDDADKAKLTAWMKYIKAVKAIDTSTAPDISWLDCPAV